MGNCVETLRKYVPLVAASLDICDRAVFAENLHVNALATDGWSTLDFCQSN